MLTAKQVKAARVLLDMDQKQLAAASELSLPTIQRMEASKGSVRGIAENVWKLQKALEDAGVAFIEADGGGPGVRLKVP